MSDQEQQAEVHALVRGRVQGVFFRQSTQERARALRLRGWVRNLPDGTTVEVLAQGPRGSLNELLDFLGHGPPGAIVEEVAPEWRPKGPPLPAFHVVD